MNFKLILALTCIPIISGSRLQAQTEKPIVSDKLVFEEKSGIVAVEGEYFYKQSQSETRQWYITSSGNLPTITPNPDPEHIAGASANAYIEALPDTRVTDKDKITDGINFSGTPGKMAVLHYKVNINSPGRYYVWVTCYSSGAEDNSVHVGFDNTWPDHGQRMQWCEGKNQWSWASKQRTEKEHCGVPKEIYLDIEKAGLHDIQFSLREDGFEMDKFILTKDINFIPEGEGPQLNLLQGKLPDH